MSFATRWERTGAPPWKVRFEYRRKTPRGATASLPRNPNRLARKGLAMTAVAAVLLTFSGFIYLAILFLTDE